MNLQEILDAARASGKPHYRTACPECNRDDAFVVTDGVYYCHKCQFKSPKIDKKPLDYPQFIWDKSQPVNGSIYLKNKQIKAIGIKENHYKDSYNLIIPFYNIHGALINIQFIPDNNPSQKKFLSKEKAPLGYLGAFFRFGISDKKFYICEGYATGASIWGAVGNDESSVFCVGPNNNFKHVAKDLFKKYPNAQYNFCADNNTDRASDDKTYNIGFVKANEAAKLVNGNVFMPDEPGTDFNDVWVKAGKDKIIELLSKPIMPEPEKIIETKPLQQTTNEHRTDLGNGKRLTKRHHDNIKYVSSWGWVAWDGSRWKRDSLGHVMRCAKDTALSIFDEAEKQFDEERILNQRLKTADFKSSEYQQIKDDLIAVRKEIKAIQEFAYNSQSRARLEAMIKLAESEPLIAHEPDDFDKNSYLFNCKNGTLDLKAGHFREHKKDDLITRCASVDYDETAQCPIWVDFLNKAFNGDMATINYLKRVAGYMLTGDTSEECFWFLYGDGGNGKSTFCETLAQLHNDYFNKIRAESLMLKKANDTIPNDIASLMGVRLVVASELSEGRRLNESLIKDMTGGDMLSARFLHKEFFIFKPQFKLFMYGNYEPRIKGNDSGIWRRVKKIDFNQKLKKDKADIDYKKSLPKELAGILNWCIEGFVDWQLLGLDEPANVTLSTISYKKSSDTISAFIDEVCILNDGFEVKVKDLYLSYTKWAEEIGESIIKKSEFDNTLKRLHNLPISKKTGNISYWSGIGIRD